MKRLLVAFAALASFVSVLRAEPVKSEPAPAWEMKDLAGNPVGSAELKGKIVIVDFWATWCPPCIGEIPQFVQLSKKYGKDGVVFVGISLDQGDTAPAKVKAFVAKYGVPYRISMVDDDVAKAFSLGESIPMTVIVDRSGNIRDRVTGAVPADYEKTIQSFLK
jgi:thiol-disulfide isomerase/thioredoxin